MNVMATQNGPNSVRVSWTIENADLVESFDVCYSVSGVSRVCPISGLQRTVLFTTLNDLTVGVEYTFTVVSRRLNEMEESGPFRQTLAECSQGMWVQKEGM